MEKRPNDFGPQLGELRVAGLPVGAYLQRHIEAHPDTGTEEGIAHARELLKDRGVLIFDRHRTYYDIMMTGAFALERLGVETAIAPITQTHTKGIFAPVMRGFAQTPGVEVIPITRAENVDRSSVTRDQIKQMNQQKRAYKARVNEALATPQTAVVIAPFGTRHYGPGDTIRDGVQALVASGVPVFCSHSARPAHHLTFLTAFSPAPLELRGAEREDVSRAILSEFERLASCRE